LKILEKQTKRFEDRIWDFFVSLKLGIATLILLSITSIVGTVLKQGQSKGEYVQENFARMFPDGFPPKMTQLDYDKLREGFESTYRFFDSMYFFDMYHSWWFLGLLGLFAMNLICCSINRLPRVLKIVREPELKPAEKFYKTLANRDELLVSGTMAEVEAKVGGFVTSEFTKPSRTEEGEKVHLFAQKAPYARFGVYVTHLSILVILLGAMLGIKFGYKGFVWITEGGSINQVTSREGQGVIPLGFTVQCDQFELEYYEASSMPKEYRSDLVVFENGQEILKKRIVVNDPLTYNGITFYQSSYRPVGGGVYRLSVTPRGGSSFEVEAKEGAHIDLPNGGSFAVSAYEDNLRNFGPGLTMHVNSPDGKHGNPFPIYQYHPGADAQIRKGEFSFDLIGADLAYATGLQVAKDPGVEVVWVGCTLMIFGTMIAFFLSHRRIWVTLVPEGRKVKVLYGGNAHRNQPGFALYFDNFKSKFKKIVS
jgi:cytochrome c biogenesis protein